jgi:anti-sigma regulatory factor (Ser/Thr protein kinase)
LPPASEQSGQPPEQEAGRHEPSDSRSLSHDLTIVLLADVVTPSIARARLRDWLLAHRWPGSRIDELVLAVSEAVSNSVEHGYLILAGTVENPSDFPSQDLNQLDQLIEIHGRLVVHDDRSSHVELTVRDQGQWLAPDPLPTTRGRGITLMRASVEEMDFHHTDEGTTVVLRSRPVPPPLNGM